MEFYACKVIQHSHNLEPYPEQEAILTISRKHHPNIINVIDTWIEQNSLTSTCYIQMELCKGDLQQFVQQRLTDPLTSLEIWDVFHQIVAGIEYIHSQEMIHRDLKPKNGECSNGQLLMLVLYTVDANLRLVWKITDFGFSETMARGWQPKRLSFGRMTRNYFAPELLISYRYDKKVDIWSAGCLLYELAVGKPAFLTDEAVRQYAWSGADTPRVSAVREDLDNGIERMIGSTLSISAEMRPDATRMLRDIPKEGLKEKYFE